VTRARLAAAATAVAAGTLLSGCAHSSTSLTARPNAVVCQDAYDANYSTMVPRLAPQQVANILRDMGRATNPTLKDDARQLRADARSENMTAAAQVVAAIYALCDIHRVGPPPAT